MTVMESLQKRREVFWLNAKQRATEPYEKIKGYYFVYIQAAQTRFMRYMPYIAMAFPETAAKKGVIESPLLPIPQMKKAMEDRGIVFPGSLYLKDDARLPIAGSVKARGGIHEVMKLAETLAMKSRMMMPAEDHSRLWSDEFKEYYSKFTVQVGSTGNLGISIGRMAARMGFHVIVHMSCDAKEWKKKLLRDEGVEVIEYQGDYSQAVAEGRRQSEADPDSFFIDDENSRELFWGYATAALRLKVQLRKAQIAVDHEHPLFVYLPCGVGGAPAGITFGLKQLFGDDVHCFFAEPTEAPCFLLGMASGSYDGIRVSDIGLSGRTVADGLAVGRPSGFACSMMEELLSGVATISDEKLLAYQKELLDVEGIYLEPSACAGFKGLELFTGDPAEISAYISKKGLAEHMANATHIVWGTGGGLVPEDER